MATPKYADLASMVNSVAFIDRCAFAVVKYASYILNNNASTIIQLNWAKGAIQNPVGVVNQLRHAIAYDSKFTAQNPLSFDTTTDADLQIAVEATINNTLLKF